MRFLQGNKKELRNSPYLERRCTKWLGKEKQASRKNSLNIHRTSKGLCFRPKQWFKLALLIFGLFVHLSYFSWQVLSTLSAVQGKASPCLQSPAPFLLCESFCSCLPLHFITFWHSKWLNLFIFWTAISRLTNVPQTSPHEWRNHGETSSYVSHQTFLCPAEGLEL